MAEIGDVDGAEGQPLYGRGEPTTDRRLDGSLRQPSETELLMAPKPSDSQ